VFRGRTQSQRLPLTAVLAAHLAITGLACLATVTQSGWATDPYPFHLALTAICCWLLLTWVAVGEEMLSPYGLFMISSLLFGAGQSFLEVVGMNPDGYLDGRYPDEVVTVTLIVSIVGLSALHAGALSALWFTRRRSSAFHAPISDRSRELRLLGRVMLIAALPPTCVQLWSVRSLVLQGGYGALYQVSAPTGFGAIPQILATLLVPGALFLYAGTTGRAREQRFAAAVLLVYSALQMMIGYRSTGAMPIAAWLWLRHRCVKPVPLRSLAIVCAVMLGIIFPAIREIRGAAGQDRLSVQYFSEAYRAVDNPVISMFREFGGTARVVADTISLVPESRPYDYGASYGYAALTIFPNLFWDIHPSVRHGTISDWLIWTVEPASAAAGGGLGYSDIAEGYFNAGWSGVLITLFVIGWGLCRAQAWANDLSRITIVAIVTAFLLRWPRDEAASMIRPIVWFGLLPYLSIVFLVGLNQVREGVPRMVSTPRLRRQARGGPSMPLQG